MVLRHTFEVGLESVNGKYEMTDKRIFACLEDIATMHSHLARNDMSFIAELNQTWVLIEWVIDVRKRPVYSDVIEVATWTRKEKSRYALRDFEITCNGEVCAVASSKWLVVDIDSRKIIRLTDEFTRRYMPEERAVLDISSLSRLSVRDDYDRAADISIRKSDIDMNGHVHNLVFMDYLAEVRDFNETDSFMRITYRKEILYEDTVKVKRVEKEGMTYYAILGEDGTVYALAESR